MSSWDQDELLGPLAGAPTPGGDARSQKEAQALRAYFQRTDQPTSDELAQQAAQQVRMMNYLAAKGAFTQASPAGAKPWPWQSALVWLFPVGSVPRLAMAAGLAVAVIAAPVLVYNVRHHAAIGDALDGEAGDGYRGSVAVQKITVPDPVEAAARLEQGLGAAGVAWRQVEIAAGLRIEARIAAPQREAAGRALAAVGAVLPADEILVLELKKSP